MEKILVLLKHNSTSITTDAVSLRATTLFLNNLPSKNGHLDILTSTKIKCEVLSPTPKLTSHHTSSLLQTLHVIRIPLHHLPPTIQILRMVVGSTNGILIHMSKLRLNPSRVITLLM